MVVPNFASRDTFLTGLTTLVSAPVSTKPVISTAIPLSRPASKLVWDPSIPVVKATIPPPIRLATVAAGRAAPADTESKI